MTPAAAVQRFWEGFGIPAYAATAVPDGAAFPYLTYSLPMASWGAPEATMQASVWYKTTSEAVPNSKAEEIRKAIGIGGVTLGCDGGMLWLKPGSPFWQPVPDEDNSVKRRLINITVEHIIL